MENQNQPREPLPVSQLIDKLPGPPDKPEHPRKPSTYDTLLRVNPEHHLIKKYDEAKKKWDEYWESVRVQAPPPEKEKIKKLVEVDYVSVYHAFKIKYFEITGKYFDGEANEGEGKILVYTLLYYFFRSDKFLNSPLLNKEINQPSKAKGLFVIGGYGCGKTSIFKAIRKLFFDAQKNQDIVVKDVDNEDVLLHRYQRGFGYFSTNDAVRQYESLQNQEHKDRFWRTMTSGQVYFDDLLTERKASNYGSVEIFKDIIEIRYDKKAVTMLSCNYSKNEDTGVFDIDSTLKAIGDKYGGRAYDRIFDMVNFIEMKGKSLRI